MSLKFETGQLQGGEFKRGLEKEWMWSKNEGDYSKGRDFFDIHWEVQCKSPDKVRLHIEAPKLNDDPTLNDVKLNLINTLLECKEIENILSSKGYVYKVGLRISEDQIRKNKSTEGFHVESVPGTALEMKMDNLHKLLFSLIDSIIGEYRDSLNDIFRKR